MYCQCANKSKEVSSSELMAHTCLDISDSIRVNSILRSVEYNCQKGNSNRDFLSKSFIEFYENLDCDFLLELATKDESQTKTFEVNHCDTVTMHFFYQEMQLFDGESILMEKYLNLIFTQEESKLVITDFSVAG